MLVLGNLLLTVLVGMVFGYSAWQVREERVREAWAATENINSLLEQQLRATIEKTDAALSTVAGRFKRPIVRGELNPEAFDQMLAEQLALNPTLLSLRVADETGTVRFGVGSGKNANLSDREFFRRCRDEARAGLVVDGPMFARISKTDVMVFARRLEKPDGSFAGIVYANIATRELAKAMASVNLGERGVVALRTGDLKLIARYPELDTRFPPGTQTMPMQLATRIANTPEHGSHVARSPLDDIERFYVFRKVGAYPLFVVVGLGADDFLSAWWRDLAITGALSVVALLMLWLASWSVYRNSQRQLRALAEKAQAEIRFRLLAENASDNILWVGADGRYQYVSPSSRDVIGLTPEALLADRGEMLRAICVDDRPHFADHLDRLDAPAHEELLFRVNHPDKGVRWIAHHCAPLYGADGDFIGRRVVNRDITEQTLSALRLREEKEFSDAILDASASVMLVLDLMGNVIRFNRAAESLTGYSFQELRGRPIWDHLVPPEVRPAVMAVFRNLTHDRVVGHFENEWMTRDGGRRLLAWRNTVLRNELGEVTHVVALGDDITDRKRMEMDLVASSRLLESVVEHAPLRVFWKDKESRYLGCNTAFARDAGLATPADVIGKTDFDLSWKDQAELYREDDRAVMASVQSRLGYEEPQTTPDGSTIWLRTSKVPLRDPEGQLIGVLGLYEDITMRKQAEERIQMLSMVVEQSPTSIVITDEDVRIQYVNDAFVRNCGYTAEELLGRNPRILKSGKTPPQTYREMWDALSRGEYWRGELENRRKDGQDFIEFAVIAPIRDASGRVAHYVAVKEDITERRRMAAELEAHRANLERLVRDRTADLDRTNQALLDTQFAMDSVGIGIAWVDAETGKFIHCNPHMAAMFGHTIAEMLELHVFDINEALAPEAFDRVGEQVRAMGHQSFEMVGRKRDGSPVPSEVTLYYQDARPDAPARFITFVRDIAERKAAEVELRHAKEIAEAATLAKSQFLANMSHEIRTPMNAILGLTHLLRRKERDFAQEDRARLAKIEGSGRHLLSVINDVLDFSKIEAGQMKLEDNDFSLGAVLEDVHSLVGGLAEGKGLELVVDCVQEPLWLRGDATRVRQAVLNYAGNAVKFTEEGRVTLRARVLEEQADRLFVRFEVEDTGPGVSQAVLERLFSAFQQADTSTSRRFGGTGLGLTITRRLAEAMGGDAGADSTEGKGSLFWFTAWLGRGKPVQVAESYESPPDPDWFQRHAGFRVLLVEDNPINREVAQDLLLDTGLALETAEDGFLALEKVRSGHYDLILMDMQMPGMNGLEATKAIRELPGWERVPIVALTANAFESDRLVCEQAGMNDFIPKPVEPAVLYRKLVKWLPDRIASDAAPAAVAPSAPSASLQDPAPQGAPPVRPQAASGAEPCHVEAVLARLARDGRVDLQRGLSVLRACELSVHPAVKRGEREGCRGGRREVVVA